MKKYLKTDEWNIIEDQFHPDRQRMSESIFSLGNGRFGQRGYFEEPYSSDSYRGSFVAGITFLDKTRVGWWKNGFPPYYTRIPKAADWSRINLRLIDEELDLAGWDVDSFNRRLDMKEGIFYRDMEVTSPRGNQLRIHVEHITNMARPNLCLIKYSVSSINYTGRISLVPILDGNIVDDADLPNLKIWNNTAFRFYQQLCLSLDTDPPGRCTSVLRHDLPILQKQQGNHCQPHTDRKGKADRFQRRCRRETRRQRDTHQIHRHCFFSLPRTE